MTYQEPTPPTQAEIESRLAIRRRAAQLSLIGAACDYCNRSATVKWREGRGTGHSENAYGCKTHAHLQEY